MLEKKPAPLLRNEESSETGMPFKFERKERKRRTKKRVWNPDPKELMTKISSTSPVQIKDL